MPNNGDSVLVNKTELQEVYDMSQNALYMLKTNGRLFPDISILNPDDSTYSYFQAPSAGIVALLTHQVCNPFQMHFLRRLDSLYKASENDFTVAGILLGSDGNENYDDILQLKRISGAEYSFYLSNDRGLDNITNEQKHLTILLLNNKRIIRSIIVTPTTYDQFNETFNWILTN